MASRTMRNVRQVAKPRPLKSSDNLVKLQPVNLEAPEKCSSLGDNVLDNLERLNILISTGNLNENTSNLIDHICSQLKDSGSCLEQTAKDQLDKYFVILRNASRDERIAIQIRMRLLEIIELRAMGWRMNDNINSYYVNKTVNIQSPTLVMRNAGFPNALVSSLSTSVIPTVPFVPPLMPSATQATLGPGEIIKNSGKFVKPTKIPGKNFFKDEIVIRNSDSGKVSPGVQDRLVQISGSNEENINHAKVLIEDTIRRNASPIRDIPESDGFGGIITNDSCNSLNRSSSDESLHNQPVSIPYQPPEHYTQVPQEQTSKHVPLMHSLSMGSNVFGDFSHTVMVGSNTIRISGSEAELVKTAKLVLEQYFAGQTNLLTKQLTSEVFPVFKQPNNYKQLAIDALNGNIVYNGYANTNSQNKDQHMVNGTTNWVPESHEKTTQIGTNTLAKTATVIKPESPNSLNRKPDAFIMQPVLPVRTTDSFKMVESSGNVNNRTTGLHGCNTLQKTSVNELFTFEKPPPRDFRRTNSIRVFNTHGFLLDCAASQASRTFPEKLKYVEEDVAIIIVKEMPSEYFDPVAYKAMTSAHKNFTNF